MSRLAAQLKMEYYPTPPVVVDLIAACIVHPLPEGVRLLDPCAGRGEALARLAGLLGSPATYGVELHAGRAAEAQAALSRCLACSYTELRAPAAFQLAFVNPPYDSDQEGRRMELAWIRHANGRSWLQPGGLLVWIVPERVARREDAGQFLAAWYDGLRAYHFSEAEYDAYKQVVVLGVQRARRAAASPWALPGELAALGCEAALYALPSPAALRSFYFHAATPSPEEIREVAGRAAAEFPEIAAPPAPLETRVRPMVPLRLGHLAMFLGAGMVNNVVLERDGARLLVKGRTVREVTRTEEKVEGGVRIVDTERLTSRVRVLDLDAGEVQTLQGEAALRPFFEKWIEPLAQAVQERFRPLYEFELPEDLRPVFARLSRRRPLPGRRESGLFPAQAHAAAAVLERYREGGLRCWWGR